MKITRAFDLRAREVVAFVGGGGKTTTMFRLADELVAQGKRVVTTTTTRIFAAQIQLAPQHLRLEHNTLPLDAIRRALKQSPHLLLLGATNADGKAFGIEPALVDQLFTLEEIDAVLVEADGSRMRSLKAPAEHEPVIPSSTTLLVPIAGIDVIGKPLTNDHVHRADIVSQIANLAMGGRVEPEHFVRVLGEPRGGLKAKPANARVIPLINKVETEEQAAHARAIGYQLLQESEIYAVAIGAVKNLVSPIAWLQSRVAAVILAAGGSTRMQGHLKQLLPWKDTTLVGNAINLARQSHVYEIVVVTGNRAQEVGAQVSDATVRVVHNPAWQTGRASSVRTGIQTLSASSDGAIFINADQPFLTTQGIDLILQTFFETRAPIVVPLYEGKTSSPVLFARGLFDELNQLHGEQGGRELLEKYHHVLAKIEIQDARAGMDLDTPAEYRQALAARDQTERTV